jgi:hypothetical protein
MLEAMNEVLYSCFVLWKSGLIETEMDYPVKSDNQKKGLWHNLWVILP